MKQTATLEHPIDDRPCDTIAVGPTMTGKRSARSSGLILRGRSRARSSAMRARYARGARGALDIELFVPLGELPAQVLLVEETSLLEERPLDPADQVLDRALLPWALGRRALKSSH